MTANAPRVAVQSAVINCWMEKAQLTPFNSTTPPSLERAAPDANGR
jgi:hypothetical protein